MGDTKPVAGHAAVSSVVHRTSIADGDNRAARANSDIICKTEQEVTHEMCCRKQLENTGWVSTAHYGNMGGLRGEHLTPMKS